MSFTTLKKSFQTDLQDIKDSGLWKNERFIDSDQKVKSRFKMGLRSSICARITISD